MADGTKIEWTDATWNPITGCAVVSPGCTNCYAMKLAGTRLQHHPSRAGLTRDTKAGPVWTGEMRFNREWLDQPLRWRRPRRIFVCAHGDLFAEGVPDEWIEQIFAVMSQAPQHTFQVLTKRPDRMHKFLTRSQLNHRLAAQIVQFEFPVPEPGRFPHLPLPNVWLGVSVEDQQRADERIPVLFKTPAAVRWISAEPLLGLIDVAWALSRNPLDIAVGLLSRGHFAPGLEKTKGLDWVVVGAESGPGARPMHPHWAYALRDQCGAAGVPFLFKQWGEWAVASHENGHFDSSMASNNAFWIDAKTGEKRKPSCTGMNDPVGMFIAGKKRAGRLLDGIEHNGFPEVRR